MLSYTDIIKKAYHITRRFPVLWLFGFFVVGGFSLNFLHFQNGTAEKLSQPFSWSQAQVFFQTHPAVLAGISVSLLIISVGGLLLTNWCRVMLVLLTNEVLEKPNMNVPAQIKASKKPLWPVIKVSLLTSLMLILVVAGLLGAPLWSNLDASSKTALWSIASVIFLPLAFTISCVNIFTTFFIVLHKMPFRSALNAGTDFFLVNWNKVLGLGFVLGVIFLAGSSVGGAIVYFSRLLISFVQLSDLGFGTVSATIVIIQSVAAAILWLILAILNVFFNTSLQLLFLQLVTPTKAEEGVKEMAVSPVVS
jgi:hypothetical protein